MALAEDVPVRPGPLAAWWPAWVGAAACVGRTDVDFFGVDPGPALAVCRSCPVRRECGEWAVALKIRFGVFGGLSAGERRRARKGVERRPDPVELTRPDRVELTRRAKGFPLDDQEKRRLNALARSNAVKELTRRHPDEFRAIYAAEKEAAGLEGKVRYRSTA